jgi:hypothetical protein
LYSIRLKICESFIFPLVKMIGERVTQILDGTASAQEKLPAEKVKQQLIVSLTKLNSVLSIKNFFILHNKKNQRDAFRPF